MGRECGELCRVCLWRRAAAGVLVKECALWNVLVGMENLLEAGSMELGQTCTASWPHLSPLLNSFCKGRTLHSFVRDPKTSLDINKTRQIAQEIIKVKGSSWGFQPPLQLLVFPQAIAACVRWFVAPLCPIWVTSSWVPVSSNQISCEETLHDLRVVSL